ncbi:MAG: sigma factor-like helix-turn-helix DNA-binding protein [Pleurocapsa sp.]
MIKQDLNFFEYFAQAQLEVLTDRERQIVELRYGLTGSKPLTLASISEVFNISRERIRQLLNRAFRKIRSKGQRQIKANAIDASCAELIIYVRSIIRPSEPDSVNRLIEFAQNNLSFLPQQTHALPLLGNLTYRDKSIRNQSIIKAKNIYSERIANHHKQQKLLSKFSDLLSYVIYPDKRHCFERGKFDSFTRQREVSLTGDGNSGGFYSNKLERLIQYESNLEMTFLLYLENLDDVIFYQEQPLRIFYKSEDRSGFYYPDFLFIMKNGNGVVTEIKPIFQMALQ